MKGSRMQCCTRVWWLALLLVSATADEDPEKQAKIGINEEERLPISEHEYPRENVPTRPDYRGPGHWATPAPDSGIKLGFVPIKTYAQVRRSISVKHLPRSDALASATTPEEKLNAPRLREVVTTKKITEVYTEEGYEDSAYDHGGYKKEQAKDEDYVKPAASNHQDSVAQGSNAVPKPGLPPSTWERHKVIRNETRMMFLGDNDGKDTVPMKVVASYSHTIQHPDGKGDIVESGSVSTPPNRRSSSNRRSSKVPRSSPHYTENLAIPLMSNDASVLTNHQLLLRNRHSEVSHPTMVQNYPAVIMQHNSEESNHQLLMRNQQPQIDYSSLMQNPAIIQQHPSIASNTVPLPLDTQNLPFMFRTNDPLQQANTKFNQNQPMSFLQNNPRVKPNARTPTAENLPMMLLPNNSAESQHVRVLQQISDDSQVAFLSLSQPRTQNRGSTRLMLVNNNNPSASTINQPREMEISLHYQTPPVIIEPDTPSPVVPRFPLTQQQRFQIHPRKIIAKTRDDFLSPPPQYQLTSRELVAFAKSNKNGLKSKTTLLNEIIAPVKSVKTKNKVEPSDNSTKETEEKDDHTTERTIITNGHLPWGVIANEGRKIPVSKLIPLKELSDDDESSTSNSPASSISKIIKPSKTEDTPSNKTQKTTKTVTEAPKTRPQKTSKNIKVSDPRVNDTYTNEQPHLAKFVEALTLAHYAPSNEHTRNVAFKSSGRKHNTAKHVDRNKDLQDMLATVYANKQKSIQARGRAPFSETRPSSYRRPTVRHGGTNNQFRQPQVEHRVTPVHADNDAQQSVYYGMRNTNIDLNRAPRISRKADTDWTKDVQYLSGDKEEARLQEEERMLEEEKDKELEENVAQWKQAILEVDNPKPEVDTKKYPFYYAPVTKSISPYSPLRYATNPKDIPKKTEGGMEFYESREKVQCPEVVGKLDIVPKRAKSGEWNKKPKAKLPRLRGLGDKIDCLKTKYFGEEPLDNPFFKETTVALPKSTSNRRVERVSEAEDEIDSDPLGLYADILKHVKSIGNAGNFPLHSSSNHKSVKSKQKSNHDTASSNRPPESFALYNSEAQKSPPKASATNTQEAAVSRPHAETHRKTKNKNLDDPDTPARPKRPLPSSHRQHAPHKQHPRVPKVHDAEHSRRVKEKGNPHKKEYGNIEFQTGFRPLILNPEHSQEQRQKPVKSFAVHNNPIDRPHGIQYGVSPHPYKIVSPAENGSVEVKSRKDYNNIVGMQPPPVQKHRTVLKTVHRKPKEYPTSIIEMLPAGPKAYPARNQLKRIKDVPQLSLPPLQYTLSPDGRLILAGDISASESTAAGTLQQQQQQQQQQHIDEMLASESTAHQAFQHVRTKRSEFSEEIFPRVPLDVNDAGPISQRRQDHVVVDRLGNMYYGHVNGDDAFWTTTENDIDTNKQNSHTTNILHDGNGYDREEPRYKTHDGEDIDSSYRASTEQPTAFDKSVTTKKPNYNSIISLNAGERGFSLSNLEQATAATIHDSLKDEHSSRKQSNIEEEPTNAKRGLPLTEAQSTPEVLSQEQINRILSGIISRHSYSSRYRSEGNHSTTTTTTTTTTTEKPSTTSRSTTKASRKRPSKKPRVIPLLNGRVVPELVTSTTKSPDIRKSRRRLSTVRIDTTTTTESTIRGTDRRQRQKTSRRGKSPWQETSTAIPNTRTTATHRRKPYNVRENRNDRKVNVASDKENKSGLRASAITKQSLKPNISQSERILSPRPPQSKTSHKSSRTAATSEPESTTVPPQRVQAIETRRVTKEEIFTTRYYPEHEEEDAMPRDSKVNKREDEDDDDKEIYEPYASENFHSGNRRNALHQDHLKGKSKIIDKNPNMEDVPVPIYYSSVTEEQEIESVEAPEGTVVDTPSPDTVFPQDRDEFKDATVLTYMVDPKTGIGKWIPGTEDSEETENNRKSENTQNKSKEPSAYNSDTEHDTIEEPESDEYYSEDRDPQEAELSSSSQPDNSAPEERNHYHDTSEDEDEDDDNRNYEETTKKEKPSKIQKVLQQIPKDKLVSREYEDNSSLQDDKTATDLYVLVSLLPSSEETTEKPVKYVKHPGERKYYYVQDYTDDESTNES